MSRLPVFALFAACTSSLSAQWIPLTPANPPTTGNAAAIAAAPNGQILLHGGYLAVTESAETWRFDGSGWTQLVTQPSPSRRTLAEMAYDSARNRYVMFGGGVQSGFFMAELDETWEWDGSAWSLSTAAVRPPARIRHGMAFDSVRSRTVLYGGSAFFSSLGDTWEFDGATWQQVSAASGPGPRSQVAMAFHAGIQRTVLFGGTSGFGVDDTTWLYDGTSWTAAPVTGPRPAARFGANMVYDPVRGVCLLFGGYDALVISLNDVWEFDGTAWTKLPATQLHSADSAYAFDAVRRVVVCVPGSAPFNALTYEFGARVDVRGTGCTGSLGVPTLVAADAPRLGQTWQLTLGGTPAVAPFAAFAFGLDSPVAVPLDAYGLTGCTSYIDPLVLTVLAPVAGGSATVGLALPASVALFGTPVTAQGLSVDIGWNPAWLVTTHALAGLAGW
ncbi:MAG: hypothetical protein JNL08_19125 [Planctomycetes bacterium]|nr:hypothetical protein [Planctomycetota bacterium]